MNCSRPALRYFGGKWRLAPWIISHFPMHGCYVEPFCGAASVFFRKAPAEFEVINDLDSAVVNFFRVLRDRSSDLIRAILATPYSRAEYESARCAVDDPLEWARRYYVRSWQGWLGADGLRGSSWRYQHTAARGKSVLKDWNRVEHLYSIVECLKRAQIENDNAFGIIERYDTPHTLFYLDPPYLPDTRSRRWREAYRHEFDEDRHRQLLDVLQRIQGMAVISGYPSELYEERLSGWRRVETTARTTSMANTSTEVIWLSPAAVERGQRRLFTLDG